MSPVSAPAPRPLRLAPNLVDHFYRGGERIAALRDIATTSTHQPEEWLGATTVVRAGEGTTGLARTDDGDLLRDLVAADPAGWRGVGPWPGLDDADTGLLLKLLDAGQRLPVHVHPDRDFAAAHLGCPYGKTEAWYVLEAEPGATVHLGWRDDVDPTELAERREAQDGAWMLERMHELAVRPGDGIVVPAGQVHAIGAGVLVAEAQEPTDLSILLEWSVTTVTREESHLGLGFDAAMAAVSHAALPAAALADLVVSPGTGRTARADVPQPCLPLASRAFFTMDRLAPVESVNVVNRGGVLLVLDGELVAAPASGPAQALAPGEVWAVPAGWGDYAVTGTGTALLSAAGEGWPQTLATSRGGSR